MGFLKALGGVLVWLVAVFFLAALSMIFIYGAGWFSAWALKYASDAASIAIAVCVLILAPLALFQKTRAVSAAGFLISSYIFGATTWMLGLLVSLQHWGFWGVMIGLAMAGVGVVPVGILAAAIHTTWIEVILLIAGLALTYGARALALWIGHKYDMENRRRDLLRSSVPYRTGNEF